MQGNLWVIDGFLGTIPHHAWFQNYVHRWRKPVIPTRPTISATWAGLPWRRSRRQFPAVNFINAPSFQDGHAGCSDPLDEQAFLVNLVNFLQQRPNGNAPREHYV